MRYMPLCLALLCMAAAASPALARGVDVNLNNDAFRAIYSSNFVNAGPYSILQGQTGILFHDSKHDTVVLPHVGLLVTGNAGTPNVKAGVGGRFLYLNSDPGDGFALALGGKVHYSLPRYNRIGFGVHLYFAPNIVSTNDIHDYFEYGVRAGYEVLHNATVYVSYRQVKANMAGPGGYITLDNGFNVGLHLKF